MALFGEKRKRLLGLDIGSASIKLLELSKSGGSYRVESCAVEPLPPNAVVERNISDVEEVGEALKRAHGGSGSRVRQAALAIAGSMLIARTITMEASLADDEIGERIAAGGERYLPYPIDELAVDFEVRGLSERHPEEAEVLLVACRNDAVVLIEKALAGAGLKALAIEPHGQAVERVFALLERRLASQAGERVVAVADLGASVTTLSVLVDGRSIFVRDQSFGGRGLTRAIEKRYSLPFHEAEIAKINGGLPSGFMRDVVQPFNESAVELLSRSLRFFYSSSHYNEVDHVLLIGGAASTAGLAELLQRALQVPVAVANPFADMSVASCVDAAAMVKGAPALSIACGLALRSFE